MSKVKKIPSCRPSTYGVIHGQTVTHGFRCAKHKIHSRRYSSEELRDQRLAEHVAEFSKKPKKSKL